MKNIILKILLILTIFFSFNNVYANNGSINFNDASDATDKIDDVSIDKKTGTMEIQIDTSVRKIFQTIKIIIGGLLVIYLVYAGVMMILSMGGDEDKIKSAKKSIWYAILGLLFVNIPGTLYDSFSGKSVTDDITAETGDIGPTIFDRNIFMNSGVLGDTLGGILTFLQIGIVAIAVFMIVYSGIRIIMAGGEEDKIKESKDKIIWSVFGLIFLGIMEVWKNLVFEGDLKGKGQNLFSTLSNMALFFAGPIAIFFISLAGYYYITAGGDEEKIKKAKNIIIYTVIATLILIGIYTVLIELKGLNFG